METEMKTVWKYILLIILIKIALVAFIPAPTVFSDEYVYTKIAQSITQGEGFSIYGEPTTFYPPLYPLLLTPAFLGKDMTTVYLLMKIINAILSTLIMIPAYLLIKEFLTKKQAQIGALLIGILPATFAFTPAIMAENVLYTLFLTTIYLLYKTYTNKSYIWAIAAGIAAGLTMLTKVSAILFIPTIIVFTIMYGYKKGYTKELFAKSGIILGLFLLVYTPWMFRNFTYLGYSIQNILGGYTYEATLIINQTIGTATTTLKTIRAFHWFIQYIGYTLIAGFFLLPIYALQWLKNNRYKELTLLTILSTFFTIVMGANHNLKAGIAEGIIGTGRTFGRYMDIILPLIICVGYIALHKENKIELKRFMIPLLAIAGYASFLTRSSLFPINNISLTLWGIIAMILPTIIIALILIIITYLFINYGDSIPKKTAILCTIICFAITSIAAIAIIDYNATTNWTNQDHVKMGKWIEKNIQGTILLDKKYEGTITKENQQPLIQKQGNSFVSLVGFWTTNKLIAEGDSDYILTREKRDLKLIHRENDLYLYATA